MIGAEERIRQAVSAAQPIIEVPSGIQRYAENDQVGVWRRGNDQIASSCRNALSLIGKGWEFAGLANPERLDAIACAKAGAEALPLIAESFRAAEQAIGIDARHVSARNGVALQGRSAAGSAADTAEERNHLRRWRRRGQTASEASTAVGLRRK